MKSYDYEAVVVDGEVYCRECVPEGTKAEDIAPIFADSEWDDFPVCSECGQVHDYVSLTSYGREQEEGDPADNSCVGCSFYDLCLNRDDKSVPKCDCLRLTEEANV